MQSSTVYGTWLTNAVGRALVLKLIAKLLNLPAATALPSVDGDGMLISDLFILGITSDAFDIGYAAELVKLVFAQAGDIRLWTAVLELIIRTQSTHYPKTPPKSFALPSPILPEACIGSLFSGFSCGFPL